MKICLIGGTGRSGTTILSRIFSLHPELTEVRESRFLIDPDGILDFYCSLEAGYSPYHYDLKVKRLIRFLKQLTFPEVPGKIFLALQRMLNIDRLPIKIIPRYSGLYFPKFSPNYSKLIENLSKGLVDFSFRAEWVGMPLGSHRILNFKKEVSKKSVAPILRDFLMGVMSDVTQHQGAIHYLEKNTWNILWFDQILELLPEAKIVHIYRDPRDVVASFTKQKWMSNDPVESAKIYAELMNRWNQIKKQVDQQSFMEISLEELIANPEQVTKLICEFWGIVWDANMINIDLSHANSGRWKLQFNREEQLNINLILEKFIIDLGYNLND